MRMVAQRAKDQKIVDVDYPNADSCISEQRGGCDGLEGYFYAAADKDDIWVESAVCGEARPDRRAGYAVSFRLGISDAGLFAG